MLAARAAYAQTVEAALAAAEIAVSPAQQHELSGRVAVDSEGEQR